MDLSQALQIASRSDALRVPNAALRFKPEGVEAPAARDFLGHTVLKCGPWSQGPTMLMTLGLIQGFDLKAKWDRREVFGLFGRTGCHTAQALYHDTVPDPAVTRVRHAGRAILQHFGAPA